MPSVPQRPDFVHIGTVAAGLKQHKVEGIKEGETHQAGGGDPMAKGEMVSLTNASWDESGHRG
jgi:hypothetical protein